MSEIIKSNEFWGKRSGSIDRINGPIFKIRRGGMVSSENQGAAGNRRRRFYAGRTGPHKKSSSKNSGGNYSNRKLNRSKAWR